MKFGKKLLTQHDIPLFRGQFVAYRTLKYLINDIVTVEASALNTEVYASQLWWFDSTQKTSLGSISSERIQFVRSVENEISKTQTYYSSQSKMIRYALTEIMCRLSDEFEMSTIVRDIDYIAASIVILDRFLWQAKNLILKITKKHDKKTKYKVTPWMLVRLEREEWWNAKLDELTIAVSDVYRAARLYEKKGEMSDDRDFGAASGNFIRKNQKFMIKPEDVMLVKLIICKHVPLDIFGRKMPKDGKKMTLDAIAGLEDAAVINSVYVDNEEKVMYHERTGLAGPKGNIIRVRWYGSHANPTQECWMERKTRQKKSADEGLRAIDEAIKQRFRINESKVLPYMEGQWHIDKKLKSMVRKKQIKEKEVDDVKETADSIQDEIVGKGLGPSLRTVVRRSAFQEGGDQTLRFSLDSNLHILNEGGQKEEGTWTRNLNLPVKLSEVVTLQYAILEVKTQKQAPQWVKDLIHSGYLIPSDNFSKFLYGTCKLWPGDIKFTPSWWEQFLTLEKAVPESPPLAECTLLNIAMQGASDKPEHKSPAASRAILPPPELIDEQVISPKEKREKRVQMDISVDDDGIGEAIGAHSPKKTKPYMRLKEDETPKIREKKMILQDFDSEDEVFLRSQPTTFWEKFKDKLGMYDSPQPATEKKTAKQKATEQRTAKTFFANERTLLSWMNSATFLSLAGLSMINTQTEFGKWAGLGLTLITVFFAIYALFKYLQRLSGLRGEKSAAKLDDKVGPPVLIFSFCVVLILLAGYYAISPDQSSSTTTGH
eukprot:TRINITY_DN2406_c0_g1_i1.p1 TRINITY_DN2406_c0_g1~~TRINITY_DN2406_c0_g1_i1.p1  ORF type:complete len:771 (-),score=201.87 TRINITY_DN2406_c0_g1_i1:24-2336(-)